MYSIPVVIGTHLKLVKVVALAMGVVLVAALMYLSGVGDSSIAYAQRIGSGGCGENWETITHTMTTTVTGNIVDSFGNTLGVGSVSISTVLFSYDVASVSSESEACSTDLLAGVFIDVAPQTITRGSNASLSWGSTGVTSCSIDQGIGPVDPNSTAPISVSPQETTTYTLTCTNVYGQTVTDTATLTVTEPVLPTVSLTANPNSIAAGQSSTLTWSSQNATACSINNGVGTVTPNTTGTSSVAPAANTTYTLTCTNASGSRSAYAAVAVTPLVAQGPDLTAGSVNTSGMRYGQTGTLSAPIQNIGNQPAGASNAYYELTAPNSKGNTSGIIAVSTLAAGASQTVSFGYKPSYEGSYSVRFCADWNGSVPELEEGNNCGPWTPFDVVQVVNPNSVECSVSSTSVAPGQSVTYTAAANGSAGAPYTWTAADGASGFGSGSTAVRTFSTSGTYGMQVSATNAGSSANCPVVTVAGGFCASGTPDLTITATPTRVRSGQTSLIEWSATGVLGSGATCTVSGPNMTTWTSSVSPAPECSTGSSQTVSITTQSTYTLTCGAYSESVTVNVIPNFQEF